MKPLVTSKGRITIPVAIRQKANIAVGSKLDFQLSCNGALIVYIVSNDVTKLKGMVKKKRKKPVSIHKMKQAYQLFSVDRYR